MQPHFPLIPHAVEIAHTSWGMPENYNDADCDLVGYSQEFQLLQSVEGT